MTRETPTTSSLDSLAPGALVLARDEEWMVTSVGPSEDGGQVVHVRGVSEYVKDQQATFYTALEPTLEVLDPREVTVVADESPRYRKSRIWVESILRNTPVPLYQSHLEVSGEMLMHPLGYQRDAVRKALSVTNIRPRLLLADAVGLGKTLEIGMILAELVRRGRGERILVVTPRHVLEQFQQELWARFALPLIRLDSQGVQRVRQKLPASRNPFTYFPRVIVSLDTLKSPKYRAQLEKVRWDVVVMDEIHNATNRSTQNNQLARTLAATTEALILASATPHNGDPDSFKEILRLLEPTSVGPDGTIDQDVAQRLIIRRHRHSPEVANEVGADWAERAEPRNILVPASPEEDAVLAELKHTWMDNPATTGADRLFPWTLLKAFLSSPAALEETVHNRLRTLGQSRPQEAQALQKLQELNARITPKKSAKYQELRAYLDAIGVGKHSPTRAVVFSERVATLRWLQDNLSKDFGLGAGAVEIMHGGMNDQEQMAVIDSFKREESPIRILVTGDVASEGVNLHAQCHDLVHFDIPWSLIRIQQRNGRIDRYGQRTSPAIATLLLDPQNPDMPGDVGVLARLVEREHEAHKLLGDASPLMGQYSESGEEAVIRDVVRGQRDFNAAVATPQDFANGDFEDELLALLNNKELAKQNNAALGQPDGAPSDAPEEELQRTSLFEHQIDYLTDALAEAFDDPSRGPDHGGVSFKVHSNGTANLRPPVDLQRRLDFLPQDYVRERRVKEDLALATTPEQGQLQLDMARAGKSSTTWPLAHFLGPLHPVTQWAQERALLSMGRGEIPAVSLATNEHYHGERILIALGTITNVRGQVVTRSFMLVKDDWFGPEVTVVENATETLEQLGLTQQAINTGDTQIPEDTKKWVRDACDAASGRMELPRYAATQQADKRINDYLRRAERWEDSAEGMTRIPGLVRRRQQVEAGRALAESLKPKDTFVRPVLVILPAAEHPAPAAESTAETSPGNSAATTPTQDF